MTHEKRYALVCEMIREYSKERGDPVECAEQIIKNPHEWAGCGTVPFWGDAAELLIEAKQGMDKAVTPKGQLAALTNVYKSALSMPREGLHGAFKSGDRWAVCDGYRFIRVNSKPESIPEADGGVNLDACIPPDVRAADVVDLPNVAEIKAAMADLKAKYGRDWREKPIEAAPGWWCRPKFLLDMIQALPGGKAYRPKGGTSAMYYESEDGDALLLPVRHSAQ